MTADYGTPAGGGIVAMQIWEYLALRSIGVKCPDFGTAVLEPTQPSRHI